MQNKQDITVLVTGAGRSIGREIAFQLGKSGYKIAVNYRNSKKGAEETADKIVSEGGTAEIFQADVSDFNSVQSMCKQIKEKLGPVCILINNAGITKDKSILRMEIEDWNSVISTNLSGTFYCIKSVAFDMMKNRWGRIINISSLSWFFGAPGQSNYAASKAGIIGLTRCLASEFAAAKVTVNAVIPGIIETDIINTIPKDKLEIMTKKIPLKRLGTCEDVANVVKFLVSEGSEYITGQIFGADGGFSCALGA